jgi:hypothetical protein
VKHYDAVPAWRCLKAWDELDRTGKLPLGEKRAELDQLRYRLKLVAFPVLPLEEAKKVVETSVLYFLRNEPDLNDRLDVRYAYLTYDEKDADMNALRESILINQEPLGSSSVKEWIASYDKLFPLNSRNEKSPSEFMTRESSVVRLAKDQQQILRKLITVYDDWLSGWNADGTGLDAKSRTAASSPAKIARLPLLKAMGEYRHLSEQLLTNEKIKLKTSMEPVRPSLGNWLRSYREEIGIGFHETAQRGNFLFQSVNCKRLSNDDRARLNLILKSVEEDFPLEIDTTHETIIFPRTDDASMELAQVKTQPMNRTIRPRGLLANPAVAAPNIQPTAPTAPVAMKSQPVPTFKPLFGKTAAPEKNVSGETLHFSTGHVLPAEREVDTAQTGVNEALRQMQQPTQGIRREPKAPLSKSPYSIRPLRARNGGNGDI